MFHSGQDNKKGATVILEAVADHDLRIWHCNFGEAGSLNDVNVLHNSSLLDDLLANRGPTARFSVNGHNYEHPYWLVDGIYPGLCCFVKQFQLPTKREQRAFNKAQSAARKGTAVLIMSAYCAALQM